MGRIGNDVTDQTQKNVYNTRFANYSLSNYFSQNTSDHHVQFALDYPTMNSGAVLGPGLNGAAVDNESRLTHGVEMDRSAERVQLIQRPFLTVPYLGRGSCNPTLESQLQQGEIVSDKKSVSTIMEKSFAAYALYPTDERKLADHETNWTRGGATTREMSSDPKMKQGNRPNAAL